MRWFKHKTESLNDPDISDIIDEFGGDGYMVFFGLLELIGRNWNQNKDGKIAFSEKFLRKNFRISAKKLHNIFIFQKFSKRISSKPIPGGFEFECPGFVDLLDNWSIRDAKRGKPKLRSCSVVTTAIEVEGEVEGDVKAFETKSVSPALTENTFARSRKNTSPRAAVPEVTFNFQEKVWEGISEADIKDWSEAFPAVSVLGELNRMAAWLLADPKRKKIKYRKFIYNWLARSQDRGRGNG